MVKLFFSYSHADETLRNELEKHLSALKHQGVIESWHDRRIEAGEEIDSAIRENLEKAQIILLLVSSDFIASEYCYERETTRAIEMHKAGEARVIPVILRPCDWHALPFGQLMATPKDGKAITKYPNLDDAFLEVTLAIKEAAREFQSEGEVDVQSGLPSTPRSKSQGEVLQPRSSNLRVKKTFSDHEKDKFESDAFEYISNFFENSLQELKARNPQTEATFRRIDANHFTAIIYGNGSELNSCNISLNNERHFNGITYSQGASRGSGISDSLSVADDGYTLFLKPGGIYSYSSNDKLVLSLEGAAEYYWEKLLRPLQQ